MTASCATCSTACWGGGLVIEQVRQALAAVSDSDFDKAGDIVKRDDEEVDLQEVRLDDEIAHLLARRSPVGSDLRLVLAISKTVTVLERMGTRRCVSPAWHATSTSMMPSSPAA